MRLPETYTELRKQTLEQEGMKYPGKALVAMELEPGYERAKNRMLPYIQAINEAHLDFYKDINHIKDTFKQFVRLIPNDGYIIGNADDEKVMKDLIILHQRLY